MQTSSELITLSQLICELKNRKVVIPLLQRNYKWAVTAGDNSGETSAEKLLQNITNAKNNCEKDYTIGMSTFYVKDNEVQVIDGQQRFITLSLLMKALGKYSEFPNISFGRDTDQKERENFLLFDFESKSVDVRHMIAAYSMFKKKLEDYADTEKGKLYTWMIEHVKIICRYTENEPLQEFLNLNEKKTPFSSTDYDRAYQLKYQGEKQKITPAMIIKEHNEIEKYLYANDSIFALVSKHCSVTANRMDLIFTKIKANMDNISEYYEKIDTANDRDEKYRKCYLYLEYCHKVLRSISQEIEKRDNSSLNVNIYNSVMMLYKMDSEFMFFDLIDIDDMESKSFEQKVQEQFNLLANTFGKNPSKNSFMQSQLLDELSDESGLSISDKAYEESEQYLTEENLSLFEQKVQEVEALVEKGKNYSDLIKGGKKSFCEILNISDIKQIIIPTIQRDYTFGSDTEKVENLLFAISKEYISDCVCKDKEYKVGSSERIAYYHLKSGKIWNEIKGLDRSTKDNYEASAIKTELFEKAAGLSIYDYGNDWRGYDRKSQLDDIMDSWGKNTQIEDFLSIKNGSYFVQGSSKIIDKSEFLFSVIFGYLEDGNFYLYDGQQRVVTLVYLCAFLINKNYSGLNEEEKTRTEKYIKLLKKFRFEERKEANDLLLRLLDISKPIDDLDKVFSPYIIDHSTFSIVNMIKVYNNYENNYGKEIMSFNLDYIMKRVFFEFAVVKEATVADQMYMDLNSKNVPLTPYENYKAEFVYILSSSFQKLFDSDWKYQLDNNFLNICYENKNGWDKTEADNAEELEIKIVHWCFKMSCMEYGISIGEISDSKKRLRWMEDDIAEEVLIIVGNILKTKIFKPESYYFSKIKEIVCSSKDMSVSDFRTNELKTWFELRYVKHELNEYKFMKVNDSYLKIYNWDKVTIISNIEYWIMLANIYDNPKNSNKQIESDMIRFLLQKLHNLWKEGYLQVDLLETVDGFYNRDIDKKIISLNQGKIEKNLDFFSIKGEYLNEKPESISNWLEYIYIIKLNEMLNVKKYELVEIWEKAENKRLRESKGIFGQKEKQLAYENAYGDYNLWQKIKVLYGGEPKINPVIFEQKDDNNIEASIIGLIGEENYKTSRIRQVTLDQSTSISVSIQYNNNQQIVSKVQEYVKKRPDFFMEYLSGFYYIRNTNKGKLLYGYDEKFNCWGEVDNIKMGIIELEQAFFSDSFWNSLEKSVNTRSNSIRFNWWAYKNNIISEEVYKKLLDPEMYDEALTSLPNEEFKTTYKQLFGFLPHD